MIISTSEPIESLCGSSVSILASRFDQLAPAINLKFLCWFTFVIDPVPKYVWISASVDPIDVLDSCKINPSVGGLETSAVDGITYLSLYRISSAFLLSVFLDMNVLGVADPRFATPSPTTVE